MQCVLKGPWAPCPLGGLDGSQGEGGVPIQPCHLIFSLFFSACPDLGLRAAHPGKKGQMRLPCASRAPFAPGSNPQSRSRPLLAAVSRRNGPPGGLQPTPQPQIGSRGRTVSTSQRAERGTARAGLVWTKRKRRLDSLEAAQGAPRDPRRDSRGERSPWLPLEMRPDSPGEPGMRRRLKGSALFRPEGRNGP